MAYTKDIDDANTYFASTSHVRSYDWLNYSTDERTAAITQAQREIELYLARDLDDPAATDRYRDDYACFEQALFILDNTVRTAQSANSAQIIASPDDEERDKFYGVTLAPQARRFLGLHRIRTVRGS